MCTYNQDFNYSLISLALWEIDIYETHPHILEQESKCNAYFVSFYDLDSQNEITFVQSRWAMFSGLLQP